MSSSSTPTTPKTLLDAVNALLLSARISNVMSLNAGDLNEDASGAKATLDDVCREVQQRGYEFNTEWGYSIDPSPDDGSITLPSNTLKVREVRCSQGTRRLVQRGLQLYDNRKGYHTFAIGETVEADLVVALPYEDLPEAFKLLVTATAARRWALPKLPSQATFTYTAEMLEAARSLAEEDDSETADATLLDTSPHFAYQRRR